MPTNSDMDDSSAQTSYAILHDAGGAIVLDTSTCVLWR